MTPDPCIPADLTPRADLHLLQSLAQNLIWVAPVGRTSLLGFMVCRRVTNNPDRPSSRIEFLARKHGGAFIWKKKFYEQRCQFPSFTTALEAASCSSSGQPL